MSDAQFVGAPAPLKMVDGTEYRLSPLSDKDIFALEEWVQSLIIRATYDATKDLPLDVQDRHIAIAMRESVGASIYNSLGARALATVRGMVRLVWQMARKEHPNVTEQELVGHLIQAQNTREATRVFRQLNGVPEHLQKSADEAQKRG